MRTRAGVLLLIVAMPSVLSTAPQRQAGGTSPAAPIVVRGQVRSDDDSATLLRRVRVAIQGHTATPVFTDQQGRFEVAIPAADAYTLRFTKPGFAPQQVSSAQIRPDDPLQIRLARGAALVGRVIDESGAPAVDVGVRVNRVGETTGDVPRSGGPSGPPDFSISTRTDDLGEFRIGSLPAGTYEAVVESTASLVTVTTDARSDLITVRMTQPPPPPPRMTSGGAAQPPPTAVRLTPGDEVEVVLVHEAGAIAIRNATSYADGFAAGSQDGMDPATATVRSRDAGVLTGRVTGPNGAFVGGALVRLNPVTPGPPPRVAASGANGAFQFSSVAAGTYRVTVARGGFLAGEYRQTQTGEFGTVITLRDRQRLDGIDVALRRGAVITGTVTDADGEPLEGLAMQVWRAHSRDGRPVAEVVAEVPLRHTDDRGRYRIHGLQPGAYYVVAADDPAPTGPGRVPALRGAPRAFYPGAPTLALATAVRVDVGLDAAGTDMTFTAAPTFRVHGYALDTDGDPVTSPVAMTVSGRSGAPMTPPLSAPVRSDGSFEFTHVPPGQYLLQAFQMSGRQFGRSFIDVIDGDVGPVRLNVTPTSTIAGRIVVTGGRPDDGTNSVRIDVLPADPEYQAQDGLPRAPVFRLDSDGAFQVSGLVGPVRFVDARAPAGWWLESVNIGGVNAADEPVLFQTRDDSRSGIEIVFSTDGAEVSGRAIDGRNEPVAGYAVVVFPVDRDRWYTGSRYVKRASPDQQGRFTVTPLPPGDYWIAAVDAPPDTALRDVDALTKLSAIARRITVSGGQRVVVDVPLARLPR